LWLKSFEAKSLKIFIIFLRSHLKPPTQLDKAHTPLTKTISGSLSLSDLHRGFHIPIPKMVTLEAGRKKNIFYLVLWVQTGPPRKSKTRFIIYFKGLYKSVKNLNPGLLDQQPACYQLGYTNFIPKKLFFVTVSQYLVLL
jgi:hypothetical protein